jgi:hypothetical protein
MISNKTRENKPGEKLQLRNQSKKAATSSKAKANVRRRKLLPDLK